jgi:hypothetical protein
MKKLIILTLLAITSCTTVRRDDHSYTYIHNFNSSSEEKPATPLKRLRDDEPSGDYPFYDKGLQSSAVIDNNEQKSNNSNITHNHYYPQRAAATYNPPPAYSGFAPSAGRYLLHGEMR